MSSFGAIVPLIFYLIIFGIIFKLVNERRNKQNGKTKSQNTIKLNKSIVIFTYFTLILFCAISYPFITKGFTTVDMDKYGEQSSGSYSIIRNQPNDLDDLNLIQTETFLYDSSFIYFRSNEGYLNSTIFVEKTDNIRNQINVYYYSTEEGLEILGNTLPFPDVNVTNSDIRINEVYTNMDLIAFKKEFPITHFKKDEAEFIDSSKLVFDAMDQRAILIQIPKDLKIYNDTDIELIDFER